MKILMTGVSSFTGCHIARALVQAGHQLVALLTRPASSYEDKLEKLRLKHSLVEDFVYEAPFGSDKFLESISTYKAQYFLNHGAPIAGYRSPDFDFLESAKKSLFRVKEVMAALKKSEAFGILHSGTVFEANSAEPAMSPYGLSKGLVSDTFKFYASESRLVYKTILIPNPIGLYENTDRLIPIFISKWIKGEKVLLNQSEQVNDNIPAAWLADFYVQELSEPFRNSKRKPSGFVLSNLDLCLEMKKYFELVFKKTAILEVQAGNPKSARLGEEPTKYLGSEQAREEFWVSLLGSYLETP